MKNIGDPQSALLGTLGAHSQSENTDGEKKASENFFWSTEADRWICKGYREARGILRDTRGRFAVKRFPTKPLFSPTGLEQLPVHLLRPADDPVIHQQVKETLTHHLAAEALADLKPSLHRLVESLLLSLQNHAELDLISDFASPLWLNLISSLLAIPRDIVPRLLPWCQAYLTISTGGSNLPTGDQYQAALRYQQESQILDEARRYFLVLAYERFAHPGTDLMSDLVRVLLPASIRDERQIQTRFNIVATNCLLLLCGGYHMATSILASALWWLWKSPRELEILESAPGLFAVCFDEVLRLSTPYLFLVRQVQQPVMIAGNRVLRGQTIQIILPEANRDASIYPEPDSFRLERKNRQPSLAFGVGDRVCMGIEGIFLLLQTAIPTFFHRFTDLRMDAELDWHETTTMRYLPRLACWPATPSPKPRHQNQTNSAIPSFVPMVALDNGLITIQFPAQPSRLAVSLDSEQGTLTLTLSGPKETTQWTAPLSALGTNPTSFPGTPSLQTMPEDDGKQSEEQSFRQDFYRLLASALDLPEQQVHGDMDFFDVGGDSLAVSALVTALSTKFHLEVEPGIIFDHPIFKDLAAVLFLQKQKGHQKAGGLHIEKEVHV